MPDRTSNNVSPYLDSHFHCPARTLVKCKHNENGPTEDSRSRVLSLSTADGPKSDFRKSCLWISVLHSCSLVWTAVHGAPHFTTVWHVTAGVAPGCVESSSQGLQMSQHGTVGSVWLVSSFISSTCGFRTYVVVYYHRSQSKPDTNTCQSVQAHRALHQVLQGQCVAALRQIWHCVDLHIFFVLPLEQSIWSLCRKKTQFLRVAFAFFQCFFYHLWEAKGVDSGVKHSKTLMPLPLLKLLSSKSADDSMII